MSFMEVEETELVTDELKVIYFCLNVIEGIMWSYSGTLEIYTIFVAIQVS